MFGGGNKCATCNKSVYSNEQVSFEKKFYHTTCFKCSICDTIINSTSKAGSMDGVVSHRLCFEKQMKTTGGKYGGEKVVANKASAAVDVATKPAPPPPGAARPAPTSAASPAPPPSAAALPPAPKPVWAPKPAPAPAPKPEAAKPAPVPKPAPAPAPAPAPTVTVERKQSTTDGKVAATPQELPLVEVRPTEKQMEHIRRVFEELDKNKTGFLADLVGASKKAGWPVDEATAKKLLDSWSGRFDFGQFVSALLPVMQVENRNWQWVAQLPVMVEEDKGPAIPGRWKTVRVFLSSTFVDMHGERDCLINEVFPEINNRVKSHYVRVVPVDLRWGVSSEETSTIQSTCLNEIDHCRTKSTCLPWFVGLRGRRLGWVQTKYQPPTDFENPDKLKWVPEFWRTETPQSITSMEVYHAFVGAAPPTDDVVRSLFLFRKDEFAGDCPENMRWLFDFEYLPSEKEGNLDKEVQHQYAYVNEYKRYLDDYEKLQQQIKDSPHPKAIFEYPCNFKEAKLTGQLPWGKKFGVGSVGALDRFRDFITETLTESIKAEFPFPGELTSQERESAKHSALIEDRAEGFVGRKELLQRMLDYAQGRVAHKGAMVIVGEPGSGKSALMARFCEMYRALLQQQGESKTILISHLVGATEDSELVAKLLARICEVIRDKASDEYFPAIPNDFDTLKKETWSNFVENATKAGYRVVIVLDAVNQLRPLNNAHLMNWLPKELPRNCRIVISTLEFENNTYANLKQFQTEITEERVTPLDASDRQALVSALLAKYHKKLTCDNKDTFLGNQMEILLAKEQGTSPLYLVVVCDVLRRFGVYEKLTEYLRSLPGTIPKLFEFVLADLEAQHGQALVRIVTSLLAVSRSGLSELEILAVLSTPEVQKELGETRSNFSQLYGPLRNFFSSGGEGYIRFFHDQLLYVVRSRYGLKPFTHASNQAHRFLGQYFQGVVLEDLAGRTQATASHAYAEVAYHLLNANLDTDLRKLFLTLDFQYRRIELVSIFALLDDLELYFTVATDPSVKLLRAALQLAIPILAQGPSELLLQLYLRLSLDVPSHPDLKAMLDVASDAWNSSRGQHKSGLLPVYDTGIVRPGTVISRFQGATSKMSLVAYLGDGSVLLTVQESGEVNLWDLVSCKPLAALQSLTKLVGASLSPDKGTLLTVGRTASEPEVHMLLWDLLKPQPTSTPLASKDVKLQKAQGYSISEDWKQVVTWHENATVAFWDLTKPESSPRIARHTGFYDQWQKKKDAEKVVEKRKADRKTARTKKQEARGGEAHSSDESQGDEDDGFEVDYQYSVKCCTVFSKFAITMSDGDDGTICVWDNRHTEPIATFVGGNSSDSMQGCQVLGEEAKNGPCLLIWSFDGVRTWNFNDLTQDTQGDFLKLSSVEKVIPNGKANQLVLMTDDDMKVFEFALPSVGSAEKIAMKVVSEYSLPKVKGTSNNLEDVTTLKNGQVAFLSYQGQVFIHGQDGKTEEHQLVWAPSVDLAVERKKEKESKGEYNIPQASGLTWNGERLLVGWDNGRMTLWNPNTKKSNYFFVDSNKYEGLQPIPAPGTEQLNRAVQWSSGTISYLDLTHEGISKAAGDELAVVRAQEVPPTYVRAVAPMKNSTSDCFFAADKQRAVTYDCMTGESYVYHLSGLYAVSLLDAGTSSNMNAGLVDGNKYISSHTNGLCLWDLNKLNPNKDGKIVPDKDHKLLKHRTKKDPGDLVVTPRLACNLGNKWTTAYQIPSGKSFVLKSDTDMYGVIPVGEDNAVQWSEKDVFYWTVSTESSVVMKGHTRSINDVYVSDDKKFILSTSDDNSVRLWDIATQVGTVLMGVHQGAAKAKFLGNKPMTWGKTEVCVWDVENNAVKGKVIYRIPDWSDDDGIEDVMILTDNIILVRGPSCMFFDLKEPTKPVEQYVRVQKLFPLECKEGVRVVGCARNGTLTLMTVGTGEDGLEVSREKLLAHSAQADVKPIPQSSQFLSYGKDHKVICWNVEGELLWSMTFGYSITSLHLQYDQAQARIQALFVHMDGGNFALLKPRDIVQDDYKTARAAVQVADKQAEDELDDLLASLGPPSDKSLDDLLAELDQLVLDL